MDVRSVLFNRSRYFPLSRIKLPLRGKTSPAPGEDVTIGDKRGNLARKRLRGFYTMNFLLTLAYDGTNYCGFQVQPNGRSVAATFQDALEAVLGSRPDIKGCSRTDAGVHALGFRLNFHADTRIPPQKLPLALNQQLLVERQRQLLGRDAGVGMEVQPEAQRVHPGIGAAAALDIGP